MKHTAKREEASNKGEKTYNNNNLKHVRSSAAAALGSRKPKDKQRTELFKNKYTHINIVPASPGKLCVSKSTEGKDAQEIIKIVKLINIPAAGLNNGREFFISARNINFW